MQSRRILWAVSLAAIVAIPAASASWYVHGTYEPDTKLDETDNFMWTGPDSSPDTAHQQIYFNVIQNVHQTGQNPNVGLAHSGVRNVPAQTFYAYLGVWKDCNLDGFIGMVDGAIMEYREELLPQGTPCASDSEAVDSPFRQDGWVYEFLWIGPHDGGSENFAPRGGLNDTSARVWGDSGKPGQAPRGSCAVNPTPAGTTASTGGLIQHVDCIAARRIANTVNDADAVLGLGIGFEDPNKPQASDSPLNVRFPVHPFYDPYRNDGSETGAVEDTEANGREHNEAFTVFDCNKQGTPADLGEQQKVNDPTNESSNLLTIGDEDGVVYTVPALADSPSPNAQGSFYDALNATEIALLSECDDEPATWTSFAALGGTLVETYNSGVSPESGRRQTDVYFLYQTAILQLYTSDDDDKDWFCVLQNETREVPDGCSDLDPEIDGTYPDATPPDAGVAVYRQTLSQGVTWQGVPNYIRTPQSINRGNLQPEGADYWTFYAHVGVSGWQSMVPSGTYGTYGSEQSACGGNIGPGQGVRGGWDCDPAHWWNPEFDPATDDMPTQTANTEGGSRAMGVRVGQLYNLRDVDCWDGEVVGGTGVYASLVQVDDGGPCERPAA